LKDRRELTRVVAVKLRETLVQPFGEITERLLWQSRVFSAPSGSYMFFDVHHLIFDGTSYWLFMSDLQKCLSGVKPEPNLYLDYAASLYKPETIEHYGMLVKNIVYKLIYYRDNPDVLVKEIINI
jgi:hypothetical protein